MAARRPEWTILALLAGALAVAALLGRATAPDAAQLDPRRSSLLAGPRGAKGLAEALRRLGLSVEAQRHPLRNADSLASGKLLVMLDLPELLTRLEIQAVHGFVARGGAVFVAGPSPLAACFGLRTAPTGRDSLAVAPPLASWRLPRTRALLLVAAPAQECAGLAATGADTLLRTPGGRTVGLRLTFRGGGAVTLLADARYVSNAALKETDAGLLVLPWFLDARRSGVVFDEYHQGFGAERSLLGAAARWASGAPAGWAMLQLVAAALVALGLGAVRFGPAVSGVERRRRSPLEHVEALASGLERGGAAAEDAAVALVAGGLRRRLGKTGRDAAGPSGVAPWLDALALAARGREAQAAVARLASAARGGAGFAEAGGRVVAAGNAVEDVWTALRQERTPARS